MYPAPRRGEGPLDSFTLPELLRLRRNQSDLAQYHLYCYVELAVQRARIFESLRTSLLEIAVKEFLIKDCYRAVDYCYTLMPLSYKGSLTDIGGRFNIGDIDTNFFPPFPALYVANDFKTAIGEYFGAAEDSETDPYFYALTSKASVTVVKLSGYLDSVIDLTKEDKLTRFISLIRHFQLSNQLRQLEKKKRGSGHHSTFWARPLNVKLRGGY
jgi:hypothetical protein